MLPVYLTQLLSFNCIFCFLFLFLSDIAFQGLNSFFASQHLNSFTTELCCCNTCRSKTLPEKDVVIWMAYVAPNLYIWLSINGVFTELPMLCALINPQTIMDAGFWTVKTYKQILLGLGT